MIEITLGQALGLYALVLFLGALTIWLYTELTVKRPQRGLGKQFLWRCVYCGFSYLDESNERISECPRCHSYNSVEDKAAREVGVGHVTRLVEEGAADSEPRRNPSHRKRPHQKRRGPRRRR